MAAKKQSPKAQVEDLKRRSGRRHSSDHRRRRVVWLGSSERADSRDGNFSDQSALCRRARRSERYLHGQLRRQTDRRQRADSIGVAHPRGDLPRPAGCRQRDSLPRALFDSSRSARQRTDAVQSRSANSLPMACRFFPIAAVSATWRSAEQMVDKSRRASCNVSARSWHGGGRAGHRRRVCVGDSVGTRLSGSAADDEHHRVDAANDEGGGRNQARLENPYRSWPFLLYKQR